MKILIVEDDPSLRLLLAELVQGEIPEAEIVAADNLDWAVTALHAHEVVGILCHGTFPTWRQDTITGPWNPWNQAKPNWITLAGWAEKKHIPLVVLTGAGEVAEHARRVGVPVFMKPLEVHRAIACLRALVMPKAQRENPAVADVNHKNEEGRRK